MINTSRGPMGVFDSVQFAKQNPDKVADVSTILNQLAKLTTGNTMWEAMHLAIYIVANESKYNPKVVKRAREIKTHTPIGPKNYETAFELREVLRSLSWNHRLAGATITLVLKKDGEPRSSARALLDLKFSGIVWFDDRYEMVLRAIDISNDWGGHVSNRTYTIGVGELFHPHDFAFAIQPYLDTLEITDVPPLKHDDSELKACRRMIAETPDIFYEQALFMEVCLDEGYTDHIDRLRYLPENPTLEDILTLLKNWGGERLVMEYIEKFKMELGV